MMKDIKPYGLQLCLDAYNASNSKLDDEEIILELLNKLPKLIGMRPLGEPHVVRVLDEGIKGISGFTFIYESHIALHTYSEKGFLTLDIYSCKDFDPIKAINFINKFFDITSYEHQILIRGKKYMD